LTTYCKWQGTIAIISRVAVCQASVSGLRDAWIICRSVRLSNRKVYCGKTAEWIQMPFGVVSGVGRGMGILDGVVIVEGEEQFWR